MVLCLAEQRPCRDHEPEQRRADEHDQEERLLRLVAEDEASRPRASDTTDEREAVEHHFRDPPAPALRLSLIDAIHAEGRERPAHDPGQHGLQSQPPQDDEGSDPGDGRSDQGWSIAWVHQSVSVAWPSLAWSGALPAASLVPVYGQGNAVRTEETHMADNDTQSRADAYEAAANAASGFGAGVIDRLADRIGAHSGSRAVFGEPIEKGPRTIIPVAQSMWGSGAGTGDSVEDGSGAGGGGGAMSRPLGYIEVTEADAHFVPLQRPLQDARLVLAYAFAIWLLARALNRILRG